ncbi:MAG: response regulator [Opitutaceae bacterium]|nr:response regulator [Opitutaceae bacterium]
MATSSTVLVVDDDDVSRQLLRSLLATDGYTVVFAENGVQALEAARRTPPDVVLLDIVMPELDGFEVCRQLRANPILHQVPIILLTALEGRATRLRGLAAGADEFLNKPFDPAELRTRVRTITRLNRFRQLSDERARFEAAVAHSPDGIVLTDRTGRILHANSAFTQLIGSVPTHVLDCFPPAISQPLQKRLLELDQPGKRIESFETTLSIASAPGATAEVTIVRLPSTDGVLLEFILRDITDRKHLEAQVLRLQRIEVLGQLAGGVVHDVNNLLMSVLGNAEMLEQSAGPADRDRARIIRQSAERGAALLRRILMFARGGDQALAPMSVLPVLRETAAIALKLMGEKVTLEVEAPDALPPILGDASQLHQVIMNLCMNARDAMPVGGVATLAARHVSLDAAEARAIGPDAAPGDFVAISVRDTGTGVPLEDRDRLFDPFFTTKPRETATGLGLATVLRVVRRHKGFIGFETQLQSGTCFTCYFPVGVAVNACD